MVSGCPEASPLEARLLPTKGKVMVQAFSEKEFGRQDKSLLGGDC